MAALCLEFLGIPVKSQFEEHLKTFEGRYISEPAVARDPVNQAMIRHWCDAMGDQNPIYTHAESAREAGHEKIVAPPTMLQAWTMRGLARALVEPSKNNNSVSELFSVFDEAGLTSVVATNCEQRYFRYLQMGEHLQHRLRIDHISGVKQTALGEGVFFDFVYLFETQTGETVGEMRFRMLRFRPIEKAKEAKQPSSRAEQPRPRPAITRDNQFFWDGLRQGKLYIQRCSNCGYQCHPPEAMCKRCQTTHFEYVASSGKGTIYSFVTAHHPPVPPFEYPHVVILVELEEGIRIISNLIDGNTDDLRIGRAVALVVQEVEPEYYLPFFRPA